MKFQKERCFTTLNADELKVGSKVIFAQDLEYLKQCVENDYPTEEITEIKGEGSISRFSNGIFSYPLAYLVEEPEEKKLKWTDLKVGDIIKNGEVTAMVVVVDSKDGVCHIFAEDGWLSNKELENWEKVE
jgi:hypothetical protein